MISQTARDALAEALGDGVTFDVPMSRHTSLRIGGRADAFATPAAREELARLLEVCAAHRLRHTVLGSGFNTLVLDGRVEGVVIQLKQLQRLEERPGQRLRAEAGVSHSRLTRFCSDRGLSGLEFAAGIPGTVGGWLAMNAGIPAREVKDVVSEIEVMSPTGRSVRHLGRRGLRFSYRALRGLAAGSLILSVLFEVAISDPASVRAEVNRYLARRAETQPLNVPSCGSVFKNPPGQHAGQLIEAVGLKGRRIGDAQISPVHANFIANLGQATAADVLALIREVQETVRSATGTHLEPEVRILGSMA
ncbi:MAG: UDP-N-acetylmuramate dehydrogenase [Myxococcota bacterium]